MPSFVPGPELLCHSNSHGEAVQGSTILQRSIGT